MRIVVCPKCNGTHCSEMATELGEAVRIQCQGCGYYAKRKEFNAQYIEDPVRKNKDKQYLPESFDISVGNDLVIKRLLYDTKHLF